MRRALFALMALGVFAAAPAEAQMFSRLGPLAAGAAAAGFTGGIVPDATTFQSAVTMDTTLAVTGISTFTGQIEANGGIKLLANKDLTCASSSSCEIGSVNLAFLRMFTNQIDANAVRAKDFGFVLDLNESHGTLMAHDDDAAPGQPAACTAANFGLLQIVNDNDDGVTSTACYCGQQSDDSTYDWLKLSDDTACPFF